MTRGAAIFLGKTPAGLLQETHHAIAGVKYRRARRALDPPAYGAIDNREKEVSAMPDYIAALREERAREHVLEAELAELRKLP